MVRLKPTVASLLLVGSQFLRCRADASQVIDVRYANTALGAMVQRAVADEPVAFLEKARETRLELVVEQEDARRVTVTLAGQGTRPLRRRLRFVHPTSDFDIAEAVALAYRAMRTRSTTVVRAKKAQTPGPATKVSHHHLAPKAVPVTATNVPDKSATRAPASDNGVASPPKVVANATKAIAANPAKKENELGSAAAAAEKTGKLASGEKIAPPRTATATDLVSSSKAVQKDLAPVEKPFGSPQVWRITVAPSMLLANATTSWFGFDTAIDRALGRWWLTRVSVVAAWLTPNGSTDGPEHFGQLVSGEVTAGPRLDWGRLRVSAAGGAALVLGVAERREFAPAMLAHGDLSFALTSRLFLGFRFGTALVLGRKGRAPEDAQGEQEGSSSGFALPASMFRTSVVLGLGF